MTVSGDAETSDRLKRRALASKTLKRAEVVLDFAGTDVADIQRRVLAELEARGVLTTLERQTMTEAIGSLAKPRDLGHGVGVVQIRHSGTTASGCVIVKLRDGVVAADGARLRFLWIVTGPEHGFLLDDDELEPFGWMLVDDKFHGELWDDKIDDIGHGLLAAYRRYLNFVRLPAPTQSERVAAELEPTGKICGGIVADIRRKWPHYGSDFLDGFNGRSVASILFLFFACLAPAVAFGGLLALLTDGNLGAIEMIVATALCGVIYALVAGQPLTILGSTGPVIIFIGVLYELCGTLDIPFFPTLAWVGLWTSAILLVLAATDASALSRHFTRFTDEIFAALISLIFIVEAIKDTVGVFTRDVPRDAALLSLVLALGTYMLAFQFSNLRRSPLLVRRVREFLADFGPALAICTMTAVAISFEPIAIERLAVPEVFGTTRPRAWLVDPFEAPPWVWAASVVPAVLVSVLLFLDQNITVRLVNNPNYKLRKGAGYHLDLAAVGVLVGVCSLFGLPWVVAATVRSLNHVRSLATIQPLGDREQIISTNENRLTALVVHLAMGASLTMLQWIARVPMSVLFGLFLFMGVASLRNNQFAERLRLWAMEPARYPPSHYVRRVPRRTVHLFTAIQIGLLALLWVVKISVLSILFPLFIAALIPVRYLLKRFFDPQDLQFLDAEEEPAEEQYRDLD